ncbi:hypothetical protein QJS04_geneDACA009102 [Acorus gramineus]|uniref:RRM domain-containing protein n=1 Tax=Acorus gramineus TaxID=55184 RepID=A0AAV9ARW1_ACOGR|nr:hypothetical protein QJS04_geneDACA009102 [Acorus gramineus]
MSRNPACSVYIGNLDEKVTERILYEILIQVGQIVDLHIPRDKETNRHKGYAFAEYETEEIAEYAIKLFSGLVCLHNKTLKFAKSGQDKISQNTVTPVTPKLNPLPTRPLSMPVRDAQMYEEPGLAMTSCRFSAHKQSTPINYSQAPTPALVRNGSHTRNFENGSMFSGINRYDSRSPLSYPSY